MTSSTHRTRRRGHHPEYPAVTPPRMAKAGAAVKPRPVAKTPSTQHPQAPTAAARAPTAAAAQAHPAPVDSRSIAGLGPYESRYDISIGYGVDRRILVR
jgi:hypothetical protein